MPKFKEKAKNPKIEEKGFVLYYTSQCPFNDKYVPKIEEISINNNIDFKRIHLQTKKQAQNAPTPCTTYALFYDGCAFLSYIWPKAAAYADAPLAPR